MAVVVDLEVAAAMTAFEAVREGVYCLMEWLGESRSRWNRWLGTYGRRS
jgi:hypothetical protein